MAMELNALIAKIKTDGVNAARKESDDIIAKAQAEAKRIVDEAIEKKRALIEEGRREAVRLEEAARRAIGQASRDAVLSLREKIVALFDAVVKDEISGRLSGDSLQQLLMKVVENFKKEKSVDLEILLSEKDKNALEKTFFTSLKEEMKKGITLKVSSGVEKGFRVGQKGKNFFYDFTDEAITEALIRYLNPKIVEIIETKSAHGK